MRAFLTTAIGDLLKEKSRVDELFHRTRKRFLVYLTIMNGDRR